MVAAPSRRDGTRNRGPNPMMIQAILIPLFVQVALTFALLFAMAGLRTRDIKSGAVDRHRIALREPNWPTRTTQVANSFANQFEVPVLFYVLVILLIVLHHADLIFVILAWILDRKSTRLNSSHVK